MPKKINKSASHIKPEYVIKGNMVLVFRNIDLYHTT